MIIFIQVDLTAWPLASRSKWESKSSPKCPGVLSHCAPPSQPLSRIHRLILASLTLATPRILFRSRSPRGQWSNYTDVDDFIRGAACAAKISISISYKPLPHSHLSNASNGKMGKNQLRAMEKALLMFDVGCWYTSFC
ncbi:hypothetical protein BDZ94DRAFT_320527 [Collybia nuda]|uniref:Uncharacterized protein n=1 Tax=Collybia nuda TaxID=64659 RepID=A0A9P6CD75_9AGAR|nr:hypothetical protein BDZ94DRAFT_320527 [Collybia nuda]